MGHGGKSWAMFSLQRFIFIVPLRNTGDCTEFGPEGITNFIKNKIKFWAADFSAAANFSDKIAGHLLTRAVWVTLDYDTPEAASGLLSPARGTGSAPGRPYGNEVIHVSYVFSYVLVCILQYFGSEYAADRKCFSIHVLCWKAAFQ